MPDAQFDALPLVVVEELLEANLHGVFDEASDQVNWDGCITLGRVEAGRHNKSFVVVDSTGAAACKVTVKANHGEKFSLH